MIKVYWEKDEDNYSIWDDNWIATIVEGGVLQLAETHKSGGVLRTRYYKEWDWIEVL